MTRLSHSASERTVTRFWLSAKWNRAFPDDAVLSLANTRGAVLITSDKDFGELVFRDGRVSHGVLLVRLAGLSLAMKAEIVSSAVRDLGPETQRAFTVVSPGIVRVRRRI